jgi:hypothetical protein
MVSRPTAATPPHATPATHPPAPQATHGIQAHSHHHCPAGNAEGVRCRALGDVAPSLLERDHHVSQRACMPTGGWDGGWATTNKAACASRVWHQYGCKAAGRQQPPHTMPHGRSRQAGRLTQVLVQHVDGIGRSQVRVHFAAPVAVPLAPLCHADVVVGQACGDKGGGEKSPGRPVNKDPSC